MSFRPFKAMTFDVVGTLIDFEAGILNHVRKVSGEAGKAHGDDDILQAYRYARASEEAGWFPDDLERCYYLMAAQLGLPDSEAHAKGLAQSVREWPAFADSVEALKRLRKHFKLVAMTNAQRWALDFMAKTLDSPFDYEFTIDDSLRETRSPVLCLRSGRPVCRRYPVRGHHPHRPESVSRYWRRHAPGLPDLLDRAALRQTGLRRHP